MENLSPTTSIGNSIQPGKQPASYPLGWAALNGTVVRDLSEERALERPMPSWARRSVCAFAAAVTIACTTGLAATQAEAQYYRYPAPQTRAPSFRPSPQMIMPAIRGASRLGWYGGSYWSQRQYGPTANPGPWPGLGPALGFRRR